VANKTEIKITNAKQIGRLADRFAKRSKVTAANLDTAVKQAAFLIDRKAKEKIQKGSRSGRIYTRGSIVHQASSAGEAPKTDTGRLVSSIRPVFHSAGKAEVGSLANIAVYGAMLETGTANMAARPWLEPTLQENQDGITKIFDSAIRRGGLAS
jgi:HK97 gp10 family phage protein